jgi:spermidine synthase
VPWLFLLAYTCSGFAGLIYEVSWTRLLTLSIGHTTGAASAVVAAFLGGLAAGAAAGGALASRLSPRQGLRAYVVIELAVAAAALAIPWVLGAATPLLSWAYGDGAPGAFFGVIRLLLCFGLVFVPAAALGASFPLAIRWFADGSAHAARATGALYALNTAGAAAGALVAGFVLIPAIGVSGTTLVGVAATAIAALSVVIVLSHKSDSPRDRGGTADAATHRSSDRSQGTETGSWIFPAAVLGFTGFASLMHEIVWTRILSLLLGPTIYAFSATLAALIAGVAVGSAIGTWMVGRTRAASMWLAAVCAAAALTVASTSWVAGGPLVGAVARQMAAPDANGWWLQQGLLIAFALILPTAVCLGAAFPLALATTAEPGAAPSRGRPTAAATDDGQAARQFGLVYAVNTVGAVSGSLAAGFVFIPLVGLQSSLFFVSICLIAASLIAMGRAAAPRSASAAAGAALAAAAVLAAVPPWDRSLLASGGYLYAQYVPGDLDPTQLLRAGTLLYYREGASATVSVKRLTGTLTLAVDGKTDASNRGDMLTQKLIAHLPLLLHEQPREVAIIGLGSGVTLGSALRHPIVRADVLEISAEVVEASRFFNAENHHALDDPRSRLIVGDGRSHLQLTSQRYDVIISEPSNPWIAGVASLFTREFFAAAADRLAPGGIIGQWANAYNISDHDLRAIVATFRSVFPDGTVWMVGGDDVLLIGSKAGGPPLDARLAGIAAHWARPGVAADLAERSVIEPFSILSMFAGGPAELESYAAAADLLTDDRMTLEFSAPRELHRQGAAANSAALAGLLKPDGGPAAIRHARAAAGAAEWRHRAAMMARRDAHAAAFDDFVQALRFDPVDPAALEGFVRTAVLLRRGADALSWIKTLTADRAPSMDVLLARSKLLAAVGSRDDAVDAARQAAALAPSRAEPLEQLASLHADAADTVKLDAAVNELNRTAPDRAATHYYAAVAAYLHGRPEDAVAHAQRAISADPSFAPVHDLIGAAFTRLGRPEDARSAFETSLGFDAHDSSAYTNLGLLALAAGHREVAANYFAEALWLTPDSTVARDGLARAR